MKKNKKKKLYKLSKNTHVEKTHAGYNDSPGMKFLTPEICLIGIFSLALLIRLLYLYQVISTPLFQGLVADAEKYDSFALQILKGNFTQKDFIYLNPLYPFFLALTYFIFGHSQLAAVLIQAVIDSLNCILIYYAASTLTNQKVGLIAALTYTCYGITIFYTGTLLAPTLVIFFLLLFISSLLAAQKGRTLFIFFTAGIFLGLAVLARPNVMLFICFIPLWFYTSLINSIGGRKTILGFLLLIVGLFTAMSPVIIRSYLIENRFSPFAVQGGINFYIGNNPDATGTFMAPQGISSSPIDQVKTSVNYAEKESGKSLNPSQASRYWLLKGLRFIKDNPLATFSLYLKKSAFFWRKEELSLNVDYSLSKSLVPIFRLPFISFGIIAPFALLGIILSLRKKTGILLVPLFIISHMLSVTIFFVTARYRVPVVPFLIICSSCALYCLAEMARVKDSKGITIYCTILILSFIGINYDFSFFSRPSPAKHYSNLGMVYNKQGKPDEALSVLKKALSIDPYCFEALFNLGNVYRERGAFNEAIDKYNKTLQIKPDFAEAYNNLGMTYGKLGLLDEAISYFTRALAVNPDLKDAHYNRGTAYGKQGRLDEAISDFKRELAVNPNNAKSHFNLGLAYQRKGVQDEATSHFKRAIVIDPGLADLYKKNLPE